MIGYFGGGTLLKLSFEKAVIFTLILILMISTANIYSQFLYMRLPRRDVDVIDHNSLFAGRLITATLDAEKLYNENKYEEAIDEFALLATDSLYSDNRTYAYFMIGMCQYKLKEYDKAKDSFSSSVLYETGNAVAYNNTAVSAYYAKDYEKALLYQKKAVEILPAVEYYYNLGRIYEELGRYKEAVESFLSVAKGEENVTLVDPVRIKNRVANLYPDLKEREEIAKGVIVSLKLRDYSNVLIIEDVDMEILDTDFKVAVRDTNQGKRMYVSYDRDKNDPYHLINKLSWKVESGSNVLYTGRRDSFSMEVFENNNYRITMNVKYKGSQEKERQTVIAVTKDGDKEHKGTETLKPNHQTTKIYEYAVYEQLFDKYFKLTTKGYYDRFNVLWAKDNIYSEIMKIDFRDSGTSLYLENTLSRDAGIRANLTPLLKDKNLKGRTVSIRFWARKITAKENMKVTVRVGRDTFSFDKFDLQYKWRQVSMEFKIPNDANNLTFSLTMKPDEQIKIDGFVIVVVR